MINFYSGQHGYYCGVDLHKKSMYLAVVNQRGETLFHKNIRTRPDDFLFAIAPYREDLVVAVECMFVPMYHRQTVLACRPLPARGY